VSYTTLEFGFANALNATNSIILLNIAKETAVRALRSCSARKRGRSVFLETKHGIKRCVSCRSGYTAWNRLYPAYRNAKKRAKKAYAHRPRQFAVASTVMPAKTPNQERMLPPSQPITQIQSGDGYNIVNRKKKTPVKPVCF
jgi:hypothetical protein